MIRRNSEVVKTNLIAGTTVKQDALARCAEKMSEQVPGYEVEETRSSKSGLAYASATSEI